jgi:hypothetical protein
MIFKLEKTAPQQCTDEMSKVISKYHKGNVSGGNKDEPIDLEDETINKSNLVENDSNEILEKMKGRNDLLNKLNDEELDETGLKEFKSKEVVNEEKEKSNENANNNSQNQNILNRPTLSEQKTVEREEIEIEDSDAEDNMTKQSLKSLTDLNNV